MKFLCIITLLLASIVLSEQGHPACYNRVGCFSSGRPFFSLLRRPINPHVQSPDVVLTKHLLYTRQNKKIPIILDARAPTLFSQEWPMYKPSKGTIFIVHGFLDNINKKQWTKIMKDELLTSGDYNVIIIDWHHGNHENYPQAAQNCRLVGAQIADLIKTIQVKTKQASSAFHIIGHSLGAHIGGYAGEKTPGLGRITGLDPAGPYFTNTDKAVRLDPSDATFVDIIHTNAQSIFKGGYGTTQDLGHADFYPNEGHDQPGCAKSLDKFIKLAGVVQGTKDFFTCEHKISYSYFTESINSKCPFTAFPCANDKDFEAGKCTKCTHAGCGLMGFHSNKPRTTTKYYLRTGDEAPFCEPAMHLTFRLSHDSPKETGRMNVRLIGDKGSTDTITLSEDDTSFKPDGVYTFITPVRGLGEVKSLEFSWHNSHSLRRFWTWNLFGSHHHTLKLKLVQVKLHGSTDIVRFCGPKEPVEADKNVTLNRRC